MRRVVFLCLALASCASAGWSARKDRLQSQAASDLACQTPQVRLVNAQDWEHDTTPNGCGGRVDEEHPCSLWAVGCGKFAAYAQTPEGSWNRVGDVASGEPPKFLR